jgi:hypothetical protein
MKSYDMTSGTLFVTFIFSGNLRMGPISESVRLYYVERLARDKQFSLLSIFKSYIEN